jgi:hypothetical protein
MPTFRQAARAPRAPYPDLDRADRTPYGFTTELRNVAFGVTVAKVRCPWCGANELHSDPADETPRTCTEGDSGRTFVIAIPAGTPIMVPVDEAARA